MTKAHLLLARFNFLVIPVYLWFSLFLYLLADGFEFLINNQGFSKAIVALKSP